MLLKTIIIEYNKEHYKFLYEDNFVTIDDNEVEILKKNKNSFEHISDKEKKELFKHKNKINELILKEINNIDKNTNIKEIIKNKLINFYKYRLEKENKLIFINKILYEEIIKKYKINSLKDIKEIEEKNLFPIYEEKEINLDKKYEKLLIPLIHQKKIFFSNKDNKNILNIKKESYIEILDEIYKITGIAL